jgi:hypothetical protein
MVVDREFFVIHLYLFLPYLNENELHNLSLINHSFQLSISSISKRYLHYPVFYPPIDHHPDVFTDFDSVIQENKFHLPLRHEIEAQHLTRYSMQLCDDFALRLVYMHLIQGFGVYANVTIPHDAMILVYYGEIISTAEALERRSEVYDPMV